MTKIYSDSTSSTTTVAQPTNSADGEVDVYVPACGSIKPFQNFLLRMDSNSGENSGYGVGLSKNTTGAYDMTGMYQTETKSNATFFLDSKCNLWTTSGVYSTGQEQGFVDTSSPSADPQWYFGASLPSNTSNYALPTCFVDSSGYFTCTRPPPAGYTSSYTIFYSCPNYWRLGFTLPATKCTQLYIKASGTGQNTTAF